ncbi:g7474 [Coccomyxa elongata]
MDDDFDFDFETSLPQTAPASAGHANGPGQQAPPYIPANANIGQSLGNFRKNYRQTVCTYWLKGLCMKGEECGFLHQLDPQRMPVCRTLLKFGECKDPECQFKHDLGEVKECNMYKLGFCVYGPRCRFRHTRQPGPPPHPETFEAAKPRDFRNINLIVNSSGGSGANPGRAGFGPGDRGPRLLPAPSAAS